MKLKELLPNPNNPRSVNDAKFKKLVASIKEFPKMMELRPIVIDDNNIILGGNMRFKALKQLKYKDIPETWVKRANELTDAEKRRFIIADNVGFGEWDWELLKHEWDYDELEDWGLETMEFGQTDEAEPDFEDLIGDNKNKPPTIKITFENPEQLQEAEKEITELIGRKFDGAYYSISCGDI